MALATDPDNPIDLINVSISRQMEVAADRVRLRVYVRGASLFSTAMALTRAREVAQLVEQLSAVGVGNEDIQVVSVNAQVATGMVLKSSEVTYTLSVTCGAIERIPEVLGAITSQKNVQIAGMEWLYPDEQGARAALTDSAILEANDKAKRIAASLGVGLLGVHRFTEKYSGEERQVSYQDYGESVGRYRAKVMPQTVDLGMEISHTKTVELSIDVQYRISGFVLPGAEMQGE